MTTTTVLADLTGMGSITGRGLVADHVADYAGDFAGDYHLDRIEADVTDLLKERMPDGLSLAGYEVVGPADYDGDTAAAEVREALDGIDFEPIFERHADPLGTVRRWADEHREDPREVDGLAWWVGLDLDGVLRATKADRLSCGRCGQTVQPYGPVTWVDAGQPGGPAAHVVGGYSFQHGCGEWNTPLEWELRTGNLTDNEDVQDQLDRWWEQIEAEYDAHLDEQAERLRPRLQRQLDEALTRLGSLDPETDDDREVITGSLTEPGVYRDLGRLIAWDYHPAVYGETLDVGHDLTVEQAELLDALAENRW
jgi:hypothetical protein